MVSVLNLTMFAPDTSSRTLTLQPVGTPRAIGRWTESTVPVEKTAFEASLHVPTSKILSNPVSHVELVGPRQKTPLVEALVARSAHRWNESQYEVDIHARLAMDVESVYNMYQSLSRVNRGLAVHTRV